MPSTISATDVGWKPFSANRSDANAISWRRRSSPRLVSRRSTVRGAASGFAVPGIGRHGTRYLTGRARTLPPGERHPVANLNADAPETGRSRTGPRVPGMETYVLRVWLPDRPGALGAVASRIGAVKGDVVGIEILETGQGQAVDELVVQLPDATLVDLLVGEVRQVDGVEVEEVRAVGPGGHDPLGDTLDTAAAIVAATDTDGLLATVRDQVTRAVAAVWAAVVDREAGTTLVAG